MPLLIDGHNLIGRLPDLSLADPHDEALLVERVRRYCFQTRRRATVVFDAGLPGGRSHTLSSPEVDVIFGSSADRIIQQRIRRARDPRGLLVVSSDRAVQEVARARGARVVPAEEFVAWLTAAHSPTGESDKPQPVGSVEEWLDLFEKAA